MKAEGKVVDVQAERGYEKESVCSRGEKPRGFVVAYGQESVNL